MAIEGKSAKMTAKGGRGKGKEGEEKGEGEECILCSMVNSREQHLIQVS